jgi:uncharacterized protein
MRLRLRRASRSNGDGTTIFFATDVHGSEVCFRKFVGAAAFYGADLLVLGGDLTGKLVVPMVEQTGGAHLAELHGEQVRVPAGEAAAFERRVADEGLYPTRMTAADRAALDADPDAVDALFVALMQDRLVHWMAYAKKRLAGTSVRILVTPGNDDPPQIDAIIRAHGADRVLLEEGELYEVAPGHTMLNCGHSNHTPWHTPRELDEQDILSHVEAMAARLADPANAIFNIHVPPYDSGLDTAPLLDEQLAVRTSMGAQLSAPVGSTAVRELIERYQPLVSLHGHVHEAGGTARIGRTVAINPGSEYGEGILRGALLTVGGGELRRYQATTG